MIFSSAQLVSFFVVIQIYHAKAFMEDFILHLQNHAWMLI
jgi:hypothetical protein